MPRFWHCWAVFTVFCALPLVLLGAEVTTKQVGMVDDTPFRAPWYLFTLPLRQIGLGYLIEHSHRLFGFIVGTCSIVLAFGLWLGTRHPLVRWLGWLALARRELPGHPGHRPRRLARPVRSGPGPGSWLFRPAGLCRA